MIWAPSLTARGRSSTKPKKHSRNGRIKCGTESNGGFRNITITGNVMEGCKGISLETSDGAYLEDFAITGNTMRDIVDALSSSCVSTAAIVARRIPCGPAHCAAS